MKNKDVQKMTNKCKHENYTVITKRFIRDNVWGIPLSEEAHCRCDDCHDDFEKEIRFGFFVTGKRRANEIYDIYEKEKQENEANTIKVGINA